MSALTARRHIPRATIADVLKTLDGAKAKEMEIDALVAGGATQPG
jgi:hypothetical protein